MLLFVRLYLFHHPVGDVTEALLADWTCFQSFCFTRPADNMAFAALDDWRRDPVVAHGTVKMSNQCIVINKAATSSQGWKCA